MKNSLKVNFEYFINNKERIYVVAKAQEVNEYEARGLRLRFEDEDGNELQDFYPDRLTFEEIQDNAIEYLNDHKHNQGLRF